MVMSLRPCVRIEVLELRIAPASFLVTSNEDAGAGSLRQAIMDAAANGSAEDDTILFAIPEGASKTIALHSALPAVSSRVAVDGTSQPGFSSTPLISIDGSAISDPDIDGMVFEGSVLKGLSIHSFTGHGVRVKSVGGQVQASWIGIDPSGMAAGNGGSGIFVESAFATIGGGASSGGNILSGNVRYGIEAPATSSIKILGNRIGTDPGGNAALANGLGGVFLVCQNVTISQNLISGNDGPGMNVTTRGAWGAVGGTISGNIIGLDVSGSVPLPNTGDGILLSMTASRSEYNHFIWYDEGSLLTVSGNVISGNLGAGILGSGSKISISKNTIGLGLDGTTAIGNKEDGVQIRTGDQVGISGNVVSGNGGDGLDLEGFDIDAAGNKIGTDSLGLEAVPNSGNGITANVRTFAAVWKLTGRPSYFSQNLIANNHGTGIVILDGVASLSANSIYANGGLGIDLGNDGVSLNDAGDGDAGPNGLLNFPVLTSAGIASDGILRLTGSFNAPPNSTHRIEFFSNAISEGEAQAFLHMIKVVADSQGNVVFSAEVPADVSPGEQIVATATHETVQTNSPGGPVIVLNGTSEISAPIAVQRAFAVSNAQVQEGLDGISQLKFEVTLPSASSAPISVDFSVGGGTAISGTDYVAKNGTVTFAPGETSQVITIDIVGDEIVEPNELVVFTLSNPIGALVGDGSAFGFILNDDLPTAPTFRISDATVFEPDTAWDWAAYPIYEQPAKRPILFTVTLDSPQPVPVALKYRTADGTAVSAVPGSIADYVASTGTLTFLPGETTKNIEVLVIGGALAEADETFSVTIYEPSEGALIADGSGIGTIWDNDVWLTVNNSPVREGENSVFKLTLGTVLEHPITLNFEAIGGTATADVDFASVVGTLTFEAGETVKTVTVPTLKDTIAEGAETYQLVLSSLSGVNMVIAAGVGHVGGSGVAITSTILQPPPIISIADITVEEGYSGTTNAVFKVTLDTASNDPVQVSYVDQEGTATRGTDYQSVSGTLTFAPGETEKMINVPVRGDFTAEADETFRVILYSSSGASLGDSEATGTILNAIPPTVSIADVTVEEGYSGTRNAAFRVKLDFASSDPIQVSYVDQGGTATRDADYQSVSGTLTFAPGETEKVIIVPIRGDVAAEADETFRIILSSVSGASLDLSEATGTILNSSGVDLVVSANHRRATWIDADGDKVTLTATKGMLYPELFRFELGEDGPVLAELETQGSGGLKFHVRQQSGGDGFVNVGELRAESLTRLVLPGRLGSIHAGTPDSYVSLKAVFVNSFGPDPLMADGSTSSLSEIYGNIGQFVVAQSFSNAELLVHGGIKLLTIRGDLRDNGIPGATGITALQIAQLRVDGDIEGSDSDHRVYIHAGAGKGTTGEFLHDELRHGRRAPAIESISVLGSVTNVDIVSAVPAGASNNIGRVYVKGDWIASNLLAGAMAGEDGKFGSEDDLTDTASFVAKMIVRGEIKGTPPDENPSDRYVIGAGKIAKLIVGQSRASLSAEENDLVPLGETGDVELIEWKGAAQR